MKNCTGVLCQMQYDKVDPATCPCVSYCPQATPPMTNGDVFRAMNNEELADELLNCFAAFYAVEWSRDSILEWLNDEV